MDKIRQYHAITEIRPEYHELVPPYAKASRNKIVFNEREIELFYDREFNLFVEKIGNVPKLGSCEVLLL